MPYPGGGCWPIIGGGWPIIGGGCPIIGGRCCGGTCAGMTGRIPPGGSCTCGGTTHRWVGAGLSGGLIRHTDQAMIMSLIAKAPALLGGLGGESSSCPREMQPSPHDRQGTTAAVTLRRPAPTCGGGLHPPGCCAGAAAATGGPNRPPRASGDLLVGEDTAACETSKTLTRQDVDRAAPCRNQPCNRSTRQAADC